MGSRIKENPQKTFDLFFEAACPTSADDDPQVLRQFPEEFDDQESIQMLPKFCFPFDIERVKENSVVQNFTFVLTDLEGNQRFGFCRLAGGFRTCPGPASASSVFYKILNNIADHLAKEQLNELAEFLSALYCHPVPQLNSPVNLEFDQKLNKLRISTGNFLNGRHRDRSQDPAGGTESLTACPQASSAMLYPMYWQHIYIPTLPPHLLDYCCAPMPYLIGVHSSLMERVRDKALEDVVILNIDTNTLESPFQDLENLPSDVVSLLKLQLKKQSATTGDWVARAFLRAQALLFGGYRDALLCTPGQPISFCQKSFLNHKSSTMREFLQRAVHLQLFKQDLSQASSLQRGGSLRSHQLSGPILPRSTQSECLQSRLPITQHFGKSRPLRPNKRCSGTELEAQRAGPAEGPEAPPGPDAIPDAGELDKSFLETGEIDLLGEIFETLSLAAPNTCCPPVSDSEPALECLMEAQPLPGETP
ncbi:DENN domain-containing protein 1B [Chelonia mydas]|uniref:DENN domain-containing protein 1B n=1 Tax=Chelonia mydas TaxID=8469 RepID=M7C9G8_CHEMY|nr:DENN domain-containing protein 1B [Chelonia mydas]